MRQSSVFVVAFSQMIFTFLGLYLWELFTTCDFEWSLIKGRRKFTWPLSELVFSLPVYEERLIRDSFLLPYPLLHSFGTRWFVGDKQKITPKAPR